MADSTPWKWASSTTLTGSAAWGHGLDHLGRPVAARVVDDDDLVGVEALVEVVVDRGEERRQPLFGVVAANDDGDELVGLHSASSRS
jgi:hypothetical protein